MVNRGRISAFDICGLSEADRADLLGHPVHLRMDLAGLERSPRKPKRAAEGSAG